MISTDSDRASGWTVELRIAATMADAKSDDDRRRPRPTTMPTEDDGHRPMTSTDAAADPQARKPSFHPPGFAVVDVAMARIAFTAAMPVGMVIGMEPGMLMGTSRGAVWPVGQRAAEGPSPDRPISRRTRTTMAEGASTAMVHGPRSH